MLASMATTVLSSAIRHARASWLGQLGVLALGAVLLGLIVASGGLGTDLMARTAVAALEIVILIAMSVRMAHVRPEELGIGVVADELMETVALVPRLLAQVGVAASPALALGGIAMLAAGAVPVVSLLLVPIVIAAWLCAAPVSLLAIVAVVHGDRSWVPRIAWDAARARPGPLLLAALVGWVVASIAALPLVLVGFVVTAVAGGAGLLGSGLAAAAIVPFTGCWALACWEHAGAVVEAPPLAAAEPTPTGAGPIPVQHVPWVDGPAWNVAIEPHAVWGTWVRLDAPAEVGFRLSWTGTEPPRLLLGLEDGTWMDPGAFLRPGAVVVAPLADGNTYLQVGVAGDAAQAVTLTMLMRGSIAA